MKINLKKIRRQLNEFERDYEEATYNNWVGLKDEVGLNKVFEKYASLFSRDIVEGVRRYPAKGTVETRGVKTLLAVLTFMYIENQLRDVAEEILNATTQAQVIWGGKKISYRSLGPMITTEQDRQTRVDLKALKDNVLRVKINPLCRKLTEKTFELTHELGHRNYILLYEYFQESSLYSFKEEMEKFIKATDSAFQKGLERYLGSTLGISPEEANEIDIPTAKRMNNFEKYFKAESLMDVVKTTWEGLGLKLSGRKNIAIDLEARPRKIQRPCVFAVDPPLDVRLSVLPVGGKDDYCNLLHETAHVQLLSHIDPELEVEYKYFGDLGFTEGMAYVFQNLTMNESWLHENLGVKNIRAYKSFNKFWLLYDLRRQIGRFLYLMEMFDSERTRGVENRASEIMTMCQGVKCSGSDCLLWDSEFYIAGYIRAYFFEAQMTQSLEDRFGYNWWKNKEVAGFLKELYVHGRKWRSEEILKKLDWSGLDPAVFIRRYV